MVMPLRVALYDPQGNARPNEELILLSDQKQTFHFDGFSAAPILSINRGFSAPVIIDTNRSQNDLAFLSAHDDEDRKSVVKGKSVSVRVDLGGRRIIKKKISSMKMYK